VYKRQGYASAHCTSKQEAMAVGHNKPRET
jgi:hypothetical protein